MHRSTEEDFIRLMDAHSHLLMGLCTISLRDYQLAQDVVQETFLRAWRKMPLRRETEKAWLVRVAMNLCRDIHRRSWTHRVDRTVPLEELIIPVLPPDNDVIREVSALPRKEREVITMHYWGNLSAQEIASTLRISRATVYRRLESAQQHLRLQLEEGGDPAHD